MKTHLNKVKAFTLEVKTYSQKSATYWPITNQEAPWPLPHCISAVWCNHNGGGPIGTESRRCVAADEPKRLPKLQRQVRFHGNKIWSFLRKGCWKYDGITQQLCCWAVTRIPHSVAPKRPFKIKQVQSNRDRRWKPLTCASHKTRGQIK